MSPFRKASAPQQRRPHPDARIEAEMQRIISLRRAIARKETQLDENDNNLRRICKEMRINSGSAHNPERAAEADNIRSDSASLEAEVAKLHDEIAERIGRLEDTDLAWLDPH